MRIRPGPDQIASILRDFQADLDVGLNIDQACRKAGIGPTTYYRWKALQEDPISNEQLRVSELEAEVDRLKLLVAELVVRRSGFWRLFRYPVPQEVGHGEAICGATDG